jgi:hypothetical protein
MTAEDLAFHGQATALVVGEAEPSRSVRCAPDPVLLEQVVDDRLLLPVDPAGEEENDEGKRRRQRVHGVSVPERLARRKTRQNRERAPLGLGRVLGAQASCDCVEYADCRMIRSRQNFRTGRDAFTRRTNSRASCGVDTTTDCGKIGRGPSTKDPTAPNRGISELPSASAFRHPTTCGKSSGIVHMSLTPVTPLATSKGKNHSLADCGCA